MNPQDLRDKLAFEYFEASLYVDGILDAFKAGYDARDTDLAALTKELTDSQALYEALYVLYHADVNAERTRSAELARLHDVTCPYLSCKRPFWFDLREKPHGLAFTVTAKEPAPPSYAELAAEVARLNDLGEEVTERMNFWRASSQAYKAQCEQLSAALKRYNHDAMSVAQTITPKWATAALAAWDAFLKGG